MNKYEIFLNRIEDLINKYRNEISDLQQRKVVKEDFISKTGEDKKEVESELVNLEKKVKEQKATRKRLLFTRDTCGKDYAWKAFNAWKLTFIIIILNLGVAYLALPNVDATILEKIFFTLLLTSGAVEYAICGIKTILEKKELKKELIEIEKSLKDLEEEITKRKSWLLELEMEIKEKGNEIVQIDEQVVDLNRKIDEFMQGREIVDDHYLDAMASLGACDDELLNIKYKENAQQLDANLIHMIRERKMNNGKNI